MSSCYSAFALQSACSRKTEPQPVYSLLSLWVKDVKQQGPSCGIRLTVVTVLPVEQSDPGDGVHDGVGELDLQPTSDGSRIPRCRRPILGQVSVNHIFAVPPDVVGVVRASGVFKVQGKLKELLGKKSNSLTIKAVMDRRRCA